MVDVHPFVDRRVPGQKGHIQHPFNLVVIGLLDMAYPNGCRHKYIPAEAEALPCEGHQL